MTPTDPTEPMGRYRLRATMRPMVGQPVNWNARAIIWSGCDRRYWVRHVVWKMYTALRPWSEVGHRHPALARRVRLRLFALVDNRRRTYTPAQVCLRRLLNTEADVLARDAWAETNRYWKARERAKRQAAQR